MRERLWTLEADVAAGTLDAIIRQYLPPGALMPGITAGRYASVTAAWADWLRDVRDHLRRDGVYVDLYVPTS